MIATTVEKEPHKRRRRGGKGRHRDEEAPVENVENTQAEVFEETLEIVELLEDEEIVVQDDQKCVGRQEPERPVEEEESAT